MNKYARYKHSQRDTEALAVSTAKTRELRWAGDTRKSVGSLQDGTIIYEGGKSVIYAERWSNFLQLLAFIGSRKTHLIVSSQINIESDTETHDNTSIEVIQGGSFAISTGVTLTMKQPEAGAYQIFTGSGLVEFSEVDSARAEWWGAKGDDATDSYPGWEAGSISLSSSGGGTLFSNSGKFRVSSTIRMRSYVNIRGSALTDFIPTTDGMTVFDSVGTSATEHFSVKNIWIVNELGKTGVMGIDAEQCRHSVVFENVYTEALDVGIKNHNLCWQTSVTECYALINRIGFEVTNSSHNFRYDRCSALQCTEDGFYAHAESTDVEPILFQTQFNECLSQGNGNYGIHLVTCGSPTINGGYVEANGLADVLGYNCQAITTHKLYGGSNFGQTHIRLRYCDGGNLENVFCAGIRTGAPTDPGYPNTSWTLDVDSTNSHIKGFVLRGVSNNLITGITTGIKLQENIKGTFRLGEVGASGANMYGAINTSSDTTKHYHLITNNRNDTNDITSTNIVECRTPYDVWRKAVRGGEAITFTNPESGQTVEIMLRGAADMGDRPPNISIGGYNINMAGAGASLNTSIKMIYNTDWGWIVKSDSGWNQFGNQFVDAEGLRLRSTSAVPTAGTWKKGDVSHNSAISLTNGVHGWKSIQSGTFGVFTASCATVNGSAVLSNVSSFVGLHRGDYVAISAGFPALTIARVETFDDVALTITLDTAATGSGALRTVAHTAPLFERFGNKIESDHEVSRSAPGVPVGYTAENTDITSPLSHSSFHARSPAAGLANPIYKSEIPSVQGFSWGINRAKTDLPWEIANSLALGTLTTFELYTAIKGGMKMKTRFQTNVGTSTSSTGNLPLPIDGNYIPVTGAASINGIEIANWQAGALVCLEFDAAATIKHNTAAGAGYASIWTKTTADVVMAANKVMQLRLNAARTLWLEV